MPPDFDLQPVSGDPWAGGAQDVHPSVARPLTISLAAPTPVEQGALTGDPTDYTPQAPLPGTEATLGQAGRIAAAVPVGLAQGVADAVTYPRDVMAGRVDPMSDEGIGRTLGMAGLMSGAGLPMAEEGALGAAGGRLAVQAAPSHDPLAAILVQLDAHAAASPAEAATLHPRALPADQLAQGVPDGHFQAFHGSPALFDQFSLDHLGSGEGVQAQGHGAYFATDQSVGAHYADTYGAPRALPDGSTVNGHMYQVAIPGRPEDFFDQGRSLAEQSPAVRAAAAPLYEAAGLDPEYRGGNLVHELRQRALEDGVPFRQVDQHVSRQFQDVGIPGHSYGGEGGQPNYVVFDPSGVRVMKTYAGGLPIPGAAPALPPSLQPTPEMFGRLLREGKAT